MLEVVCRARVSFVGSVGLVGFVGFVELPVNPVFTPVLPGIEDSCWLCCGGVKKESERYACDKSAWLRASVE